jgi:hypothetical protein
MLFDKIPQIGHGDLLILDGSALGMVDKRSLEYGASKS